jgi:phosphate acetyltransferase
MSFIESIFEKVRRHPKRIVFPEGTDDRIIRAAVDYHAKGLGTAVLLGPKSVIQKKAQTLKVSLDHVGLIEPEKADDLNSFTESFAQMRKTKGIGLDEARATVRKAHYFATMMLHHGSADGLVAGVSTTASSILRPLFQTIQLEPGVKAASSCSVLQLENKKFGEGGVLYLADCSVIPDPNAEQLADIALMAAKLARQLHGIKPRVAFLSYATKGSATHKNLEKIMMAVAIAQQKAVSKNMLVDFDGELQADAALVPMVADLKAAHSRVAGKANVLIFPDLNSGNICSKLVQLVANGIVYGPILNGLCKPASDLSRSCTVQEIVSSAAIVALQSVEYRKLYPADGKSTEKFSYKSA